MEMGLTLLFRIDAESAQRHMNDRRIHEEEEKLLEEDFLRKQSSHEGQEEEFAIVSVDPDEGKPRDKVTTIIC